MKQRKYSVYAQFINTDGRWREYGNNTHVTCRDTKYFFTSAEDAEDVLRMFMGVFRRREYVQTVDFVHVYEVGNDDNCASWER